jgi:SET domain-containing protein
VDTIALADEVHLVLPPDTANGKGNHSCDPNLVWDGAFAVSTCRDIETDEELTIDYAPMSRGALSGEPCACGSSRCRGLLPG